MIVFTHFFGYDKLLYALRLCQEPGSHPCIITRRFLVDYPSFVDLEVKRGLGVYATHND